MTPETHTVDLLKSGYLEVSEHGELRVGQRVHHSGEKWSEARTEGTAVIERIFARPRTIQGREDVELIAKLDRPTFWGSEHGFWADYHTVIVEVAS